MCLPLAVIGAIAAVAGAGMKYAGQQKADHALTNTFTRENDRQHAFEAQQAAKFADSAHSAANMADPAAQAAAASSREGVLNAVVHNADPAASGYLPTTGSAPSIVATEGARAGAKANAATSSLAKAMASMGGFGDLMQKNAITTNRNSQDIGQIGGFMRGSLDALQPEMDAAKLKGGNLRMLGGLAQAIGTSMLTGGLGGGFAPSSVGVAGQVPLGAISGVPSISSVASSLPGWGAAI